MKDYFGVPEIYENEAVGTMKIIYNDIKNVLKVPIVNFIFRTLALYDRFLEIGWKQVRNNMLTINMEEAANNLRYPSISYHIPKIDWNLYYDEETLGKIKRIVFTFNYVNTKLLLIASAWAESLSNRSIDGSSKIKGFIKPGIFSDLPEINLVSIKYADQKVKDLIFDIMNKHHAYDSASDFRALANYPDFLNISWNYLKPYVGSKEYNIISSELISRSIELVHQMPFPLHLNRTDLQKIYSEKDIAGIFGVVSMFQNFIPGLIIDGTFFNRIIEKIS